MLAEAVVYAIWTRSFGINGRENCAPCPPAADGQGTGDERGPCFVVVLKYPVVCEMFKFEKEQFDLQELDIDENHHDREIQVPECKQSLVFYGVHNAIKTVHHPPNDLTLQNSHDHPPQI